MFAGIGFRVQRFRGRRPIRSHAWNWRSVVAPRIDQVQRLIEIGNELQVSVRIAKWRWCLVLLLRPGSGSNSPGSGWGILTSGKVQGRHVHLMAMDAKLTCTLHPKTPLVLHSSPPYASRDFVCDLCFKFGEGPTYHCKACKYDLHPACCTLQPTLRSCTHPHPLTLMPANYHASSKKKCDGCRNSLADCEWSYRCEAFDFDVHARCAKLRAKIFTYLHPIPLKLLIKSPYPPGRLQCDLCGERMPTQGWVYHCTNCKFDLHPSCAMLPPDPLCPVHPHRLSSCGYRTYHGKSYVCDMCLEFGGGLGFRCDKCNFNIHPKCLKSLFAPDSSLGSYFLLGTITFWITVSCESR